MGRHEAKRPAGARRAGSRRSVRIRLLLCLGVLACPAGVGTLAYWTDTATIQGGTIQSGTLDLTVGPDAANSFLLEGSGGTVEYSLLTIANLTPGESIARPFTVRNNGTVGFTYNATIATENDALVSGSNGLMVDIHVDGAPTNTGSEASGNRAGSCGGTLVRSQAVSTATGSVNLHATDQSLLVGATRTYCARIALPGAAPNTLQNKSTSLIITLNAKQVGAP